MSALSHLKVNSGAELKLIDLRKVYDDFVAVDNLNLSLRPGELVAFLGPSGCGKTTSLRMIAGLTKVTSGQITVQSRDITDAPVHRRDMGMVFQSYALFPHMDVARNIAFGLEMRKVPKDEIQRRVSEAIALVKLTGCENRNPAELSGGQQQRVALARALVIQPSILLFDEPLSNLDAQLREEMRLEIRDIQQRLGITAIFVTHDQVEALTMCDRVAVMHHGRLEQLGTPQELYDTPATSFVASFVGRTNRLVGTASGTHFKTGGMDLVLPSEHHGDGVAMIRPHHITIGEVSGEHGQVSLLKGTVIRTVYSGDLVQTDVDVGGVAISVEQSNRKANLIHGAGEPLTLQVAVRDILFFGDSK
jgi:putative spermidine/putrescine transport system ATP-binding protein